MWVSSRSIKLLFLFCVLLLPSVTINSVDPFHKELSKNESHILSETIYTNKTFTFDYEDPYGDLSYYTYSYNGGAQQPDSNFYAMTTNTNGYTQIFGFDEFASQEQLVAEIIFRPLLIVGTYRYQPILYTYQKTDLYSSTHWAVAIQWYASNLWLYHNTANGDTISGIQLAAVSPTEDHFYRCLLANADNSTWIRIEDITPMSEAIIYNGTKATITYNASELYASFGQYSAGSGNIYGNYDNFTIVDYGTYYVPPIDIEAIWSYNVSLIVIGLALVPCSMLYLVKGGRKELTSTKFFIFLLAFIMGWSLVIATITP